MDRVELDVVGTEVLEEAAALAEEDGDQVDLNLVEDSGRKGELGDAGAVDEDVLVAGGLLRAIAVSTLGT